jgi:regulator of nucleoside diphosphate kinase
MKVTIPILSTLDKERLSPHLRPELAPSGPVVRLRHLLGSARAVAPKRVPADVVTMNSRVRIKDLHWDEHETLELTYPDEKFGNGAPSARSVRLSVVSPLGAALLGSRVGHEATWVGPRGPRRVLVEALEYQPEKAGRYDL